jgi:quinol-cytochrome oxidoreductase complex cytochrome b subunit
VGFAWGMIALTVTLFVSGGAVSSIYRPNRSSVGDVFRPAIEGGIWHWIAAFHYWGSAILLLASFLSLVWLFLAGFRSRAKRYWIPALLFFLVCFLLQVTGNSLPLDQHDVRSANVEISIAAQSPIIGQKVAEFLRQGAVYSDSTTQLWYGLSIALVVVLAFVWLWHFQLLRTKTRAKIDLIDRVLGAIVLASPICLAFMLPRATGSLYSGVDASSLTASPSWYTLPLHCLLGLFTSLSPNLGWVGAMLIPGVLTLVAFTAPRWALAFSLRKRIGVVLGATAVLTLLVGLSGVSPAPISGIQSVVLETEGKSAQPIDGDLVLIGNMAFKKNCTGCHGQVGHGGIGPDLRNISKRVQDPNWFMDFIRDPRSKRSGSTMPGFPKLPIEELRGLADWVRNQAE